MNHFYLINMVFFPIINFPDFLNQCNWITNQDFLNPTAPQSNNTSERPTSGGQDAASNQEPTEGTGEDQTAASNNQEQSDAAASQDITETPSRTDTASSRDQLEENQQSQQQAQERSVEPAVSIDVPNPEADNAANASATPQEEATQPTAEAMDVDNETTGTANDIEFMNNYLEVIFFSSLRWFCGTDCHFDFKRSLYLWSGYL